MKNSKSIHLTYGLVIALAMIVLNVVLYVAGLAFKPGMGNVQYIVLLVGIILNAVAFSKLNDGYVTFGQVFASCFKACAIITLILLVWGFVSSAVFPEMKEKALEIAREKMEQQGKMSDEQIQQMLDMTQKNFRLFMVAGIVFMTMFVGAICSVIGAAVAKKKGVPPVMPEL